MNSEALQIDFRFFPKFLTKNFFRKQNFFPRKSSKKFLRYFFRSYLKRFRNLNFLRPKNCSLFREREIPISKWISFCFPKRRAYKSHDPRASEFFRLRAKAFLHKRRYRLMNRVQENLAEIRKSDFQLNASSQNG